MIKQATTGMCITVCKCNSNHIYSPTWWYDRSRRISNMYTEMNSDVGWTKSEYEWYTW